MTTSHPTHRWRFPETPRLEPGFLADGARRGLSERTLHILAARGHAAPGDLAAFFDPPAATLHDPGLLPDAAAVRARIARALDAAERVLVFGDFDADGLTGLAIMVIALRALGLDTAPYVPDRRAEGHGLSLAAVQRARAEGRTLIVTVDTGTTNVAEIAAAGVAGIDVIVTDHHHLPPPPPPTPAWPARAWPSRWPSSCSPTGPAAPRRHSRWPTWRRSARSPMWRPWSARIGPSRAWGWNCCAVPPGPGWPRCWPRRRWRRRVSTWTRSATPSPRG